MLRQPLLGILFVAFLGLGACSVAPTATPVPTSTPAPTATPIPTATPSIEDKLGELAEELLDVVLENREEIGDLVAETIFDDEPEDSIRAMVVSCFAGEALDVAPEVIDVIVAGIAADRSPLEVAADIREEAPDLGQLETMQIVGTVIDCLE